MFKGIGNFLSNAASYLDKNKNLASTEETKQTEAKDNTANVAKAEASSDVKPLNSPISHRKTSKAEDEVRMSSTKEEKDIENLLTDAIEDEMPELDSDSDSDLNFEEEAEYVTKDDAKPRAFETESAYYSKALDLVSKALDTSIFSNVITSGYKAVAGSSNVDNINELIDGFNNKETLNEELLNNLSKMNQEEFSKLLTSQIIAKNSDVAYYNTFVNHLCKLQDYIKSHSVQHQANPGINKLIVKIDNIIKTMITDAFKQVKQNDIINTEELKDKLIMRDINQYTYEKVKKQFIADLSRFNTNFKLVYKKQDLWNSRELKQDFHENNDNPASQKDITAIKEEFFNNCHTQITDYINKYSPPNNKQIINAIMIELTQSGMALSYSITNVLKDSVFNKLLPEDSKYIPLITNDYIRSDAVIDLSEHEVNITTSFTFTKGVSLKNDNSEEFVSSGPITISYTLSITPNNTEEAKYKDIKINFNNNQN
jgi:hypothetical protein